MRRPQIPIRDAQAHPTPIPGTHRLLAHLFQRCLSAPSRAAWASRTTRTHGNGCAASIPAQTHGEQTGGTALTFDQARVDFELAWRKFSAKRTKADYQAWRDQRDWTARKYAMWERGERFPSQQASA